MLFLWCRDERLDYRSYLESTILAVFEHKSYYVLFCKSLVKVIEVIGSWDHGSELFDFEFVWVQRLYSVRIFSYSRFCFVVRILCYHPLSLVKWAIYLQVLLEWSKTHFLLSKCRNKTYDSNTVIWWAIHSIVTAKYTSFFFTASWTLLLWFGMDGCEWQMAKVWAMAYQGSENWISSNFYPATCHLFYLLVCMRCHPFSATAIR